MASSNRRYVRGVALSVYIIVLTLSLGFAMLFGARKTIAQCWCRLCYRAIGIKLQVVGTPVNSGPALLVGNHISYVDILLLGDLMSIPTFVAKTEVARWPIIGPLSRLVGVIFIRRDHPEEAPRQIATLTARIRAKERLILFPEGTSSDGLDLLPFKSTLLGSAFARDGGVDDIAVQAFTLAFTHDLEGNRLGRRARGRFGWVGDATLVPHVWDMLTGPGASARLIFHPPTRSSGYANRKTLTAELYETIRHPLMELASHDCTTPSESAA